MNLRGNFLVLAGAAVGGLLGYAVCVWLAEHRHYGMIVPGGFLGIAAGISRSSSKTVPIMCGLLALALGVFTEWRLFPFVADQSAGYFLSHIHRLSPLTLFEIAVGTFFGFWIPFRRRQEAMKS